MNSRLIKYCLFLIALLVCNSAIGQKVDADDLAPNESIYIDINASLIFTGEYLYYSLYCFDTTAKNFSQLSQMAYVELVGKNGTRVFKHKIKLEKGRGYSDYFLPVDVQSGNYKLIAYTNWMRNADRSLLGVADISIINPYQANIKSRSIPSTQKTEVSNDSITALINENNNSVIDLKFNNQDFKKREKVIMQLRSFSQSIKDLSGTYSVSVKRKTGIPSPDRIKSVDYFNAMQVSTTELTILNSDAKLPELRGELFKGKITSNDNASVKQLKVAISIGEENKILRIAEVNSKGFFYFYIDGYYYSKEVYMQVLNANTDDYKIELIPKTNLNISEFEFEVLNLQPEWKQNIIDQSVYNQIESAYFEFRSDSLFLSSSKNFFKNREFVAYNLDDYTRFKTIKETVKEFIKTTSIRKDDEDGEVFEVQGYEFDTKSGIKPLVILDGIMIDNHSLIMDYDATAISEIKVYRDQFVIDLEVFQGAIIISSKDELDSNLFIENSGLQKVEVLKPEIKKNYYKQQYTEKNKDSRLPDYRQQLLWIPNLEMSKETRKEIIFYTSDVSGTYEVKLEGMSTNGIPVSIKKYFKVN
ncbi:hypothetical protein [Winogradskyella sp. PE311]|uniref:hypothetical protein n=1 Tax=Winogradskyella sp. PE311 TaxID=3366943 RepID=UPI00398163FC